MMSLLHEYMLPSVHVIVKDVSTSLDMTALSFRLTAGNREMTINKRATERIQLLFLYYRFFAFAQNDNL